MTHKEVEVILRMIETADDGALSEIVRAVLRRYAKLFPEEEVVFLSIPKQDMQERRRILELALRLTGE